MAYYVQEPSHIASTADDIRGYVTSPRFWGLERLHTYRLHLQT